MLNRFWNLLGYETNPEQAAAEVAQAAPAVAVQVPIAAVQIPDPREVAGETVINQEMRQTYNGIIDLFAARKADFEQLFKRTDKRVYEEAFVNGRKDQLGRYIDHIGQTGPIAAEKNVLNVFTELDQFLKLTSRVHNLKDRMLERYREAPVFLQVFYQFLGDYKHLYGSIEKLNLKPIVEKLSDPKAFMNGLMPQAYELMSPFDDNQFKAQFEHQAPEYKALLTQAKSFKNVFKTLDSLLQKANENLPAHTQTIVTEAIRDTRQILEVSDNYLNSSGSKLKLCWLLYWNYDALASLQTRLPQTLAAVGDLYKDQILETMHQLNLVLRNIYLELDRLEVTLNLKTGTLTSFSFAKGKSVRTFYQAFNQTLEDQGYQFKESERYPYAEAVLAQRQQLREKALQTPTDPLSQSLLARRVQYAEQSVITRREKAQRKIAAQKTEASDILKAYLRAALTQRIEQLNAEIASSGFSTSAPAIKVDLLTRLREQLCGNQILEANSLHAALDQIASDNSGGIDRRKNIYLLWEGRTGELLTQIRTRLAYTPHRIHEIEMQIDLLEQEREATFIFGKATQKTLIEQRLLALKLLKATLSKSGYSVEDALVELNARHGNEQVTLVTHEVDLLDKLREFDTQISKVDLGKRVLDYPPKQRPKKINQHQRGVIIDLINQRITELQVVSFFTWTNTKEVKILLLEEIKLRLRAGISLEEALNELTTDPDFKDSAYLLHDGKTGAMFKKLQAVEHSAEDAIHYIDLQLTKLYKEREAAPSFFDFFYASKREKLELRIQALKQLKIELTNAPQLSIAEATARLNLPQQGILSTHEKELREKLNNWEQMQEKVARRQQSEPQPAPAQAPAPAVEEPAPVAGQAQEQAPLPAQEGLPNIYDEMVAILVKRKAQFIAFLEKSLDEQAFMVNILNGEKDANGCYIDHVNLSGNMYHYKNFLNTLTLLEKLLRTTSKIHVKANQLHESPPEDPIPYLSAFWHGTKRVAKAAYYTGPGLYTFFNLLDEADLLIKAIDKLGVINLYETYANVPTAMNIMAELKNEAHRISSPLHNNPFVQSARTQGPEYANLFAGLQNSNNLINSLRNILNRASRDLSPSNKACIQDALDKTEEILMAVEEYSESSGNKFNKVHLVYQIYSPLMFLVNNLGQIATSVGDIYKDQILESVQEINILLKNIYIELDKLEIELNLKEGSLTSFRFYEKHSINSMYEFLNEAIINNGYRFQADERFPYHQAILENRQRMLQDLLVQGVNNNPVGHALLERRVQNAQTQLEVYHNERALKQRSQQFFTSETIKQKLLTDIGTRVTTLNQETQRAWLQSSSSIVKINLLNKLRRELEAQPLLTADSLHGCLDRIAAANPEDRQNIYQLFEGRTGTMLAQMRTSLTFTSDRTTAIEMHIDALEQQRQGSYFFSNSDKKTDLEKRISALQLLKNIVSKQGYSVSDALREVKARYINEFNVLNKNEAELLATLSELDKHISPVDLGKKVLDYCTPRQPRLINENHRTVIIEHIDRRIQELNSTFFCLPLTATKQNKIDLLEELKIRLNDGKTLDEALKDMSRNEDIQHNMYLLWDGQTGAVLQKLQTVEHSLEDALHYIDLELAKLYKERESAPPYFGFFYEGNRDTLEKRIQALKQLKTEIAGNPNRTLAETLEALAEDQRRLINKNDQKLLLKLENWEQMQHAVAETIRTAPRAG